MCSFAVTTTSAALTVLWLSQAVTVADPPGKAPVPLLRLSTATMPDSLSVRAGDEVRFELSAFAGDSWADANLAAWIIRSPGRQESLVPAAAARQGRDFPFRFAAAGPHLIALSIGPPEAKNKSSAWREVTYCTKLLVHVSATGGGGQAEFAGAIAKVGQRFEIVPLIDPAQLRIGADLPVRVFFDYQSFAHGEVIAVRPDGSTDVKKTDSVGAAHFAIVQAGRWLVRYEKELDGVRRTGELVFDVADGRGGQP